MSIILVCMKLQLGGTILYSGFLMRSYIFMNYYLAGLYFGTSDSVRKYIPIKIHFDEQYTKLFYRHALGTSKKKSP